jgi:hypothetical protein
MHYVVLGLMYFKGMFVWLDISISLYLRKSHIWYLGETFMSWLNSDRVFVLFFMNDETYSMRGSSIITPFGCTSICS